MKAKVLMMGAAVLVFAPVMAAAQTAPQSNGQTHDGNATGQPGADCEALIDANQGSTPGHTSTSPGSPFNPDGNSGKHYAGEQPQNSRNSAASSQYDAACRETPRSPQ